MPTPWRKLSYEKLKEMHVSGHVLDLGGSRSSGYHEIIKGDHTFDVVNINKEEQAEYTFDLEEPFPLQDKTYDGVFAINVLEHVTNYDNVISESFRVLKRRGVCVVAVPFIMFVHPSPKDAWRYTGETLDMLFKKHGFEIVRVSAIGRGPFIAMVQLLGGVRVPSFMVSTITFFARIIDYFVIKKIGELKSAERFPLGYVVVAEK